MTVTQGRVVFVVAAVIVAVGAARWALPAMRRRCAEHIAIRKARAETWAATVRWMEEQRDKAARERQRHEQLHRTRQEQRRACQRLGVFRDLDGTEWEDIP